MFNKKARRTYLTLEKKPSCIWDWKAMCKPYVKSCNFRPKYNKFRGKTFINRGQDFLLVKN
jgi:hypothetical protein